MTQLSVNINKVAVLRNSRGGIEPRPVDAARCALAAGCHGITVHPRPDQRHIRVSDVTDVANVITGGEFNIEGNPFAPPRGSYPGLLELARQVRPHQVTLVPDADSQLTSDHGFDETSDFPGLAHVAARFKTLGSRISVFVDANSTVIRQLADCGIDRVEIYTGPFAAAFAAGDCSRELDACVATAEFARQHGLAVNAGHDLCQANLGTLLHSIPWIAEVSIGHALFAEALYDGLASTIHRYLKIIDESNRS